MENAMRTRAFVLLAALALAPACHRSSSGPPVLAAATIGPEGGEIAVTSGVQAGLVVTVPAGAVDRPTAFAIVDETGTLPPGVLATTYVPVPGQPFAIEPRQLVLANKARLRMPYRTGFVYETAPGNVRAQQHSPFAELQLDPQAVDVVDGWIEVESATLGRFQVVQGPAVDRLLDYVPPIGSVATLADGITFRLEPADPAGPFAPCVAWRIDGPGIAERLVFFGEDRESDVPSWREIWSIPYSPFLPVSQALGNGVTASMMVEQPLGGTTMPASYSVYGFRAFTQPRVFDGRLVLDVLRLTIDVAWDRSDIGTGQRQYEFWFAPGDGLLALGLDGLVRERVPD
jgi:hypothetical protein